jgi:hypothetical protein
MAMSTWLLILLVFSNNGTPAMTTVQLPSEKACQAAGSDFAQVANTHVSNLRFVCVKE